MSGKPREVERFDPAAQFTAAYRSGNIRREGVVTVAGRRAYRLVMEHDVGPATDPQGVVRPSSGVMLFDAQTLAPIEEVTRAMFEINSRRGTLDGRVRYTAFETLPRTPENLAKLKMTNQPRPHPRPWSSRPRPGAARWRTHDQAAPAKPVHQQHARGAPRLAHQNLRTGWRAPTAHEFRRAAARR